MRAGQGISDRNAPSRPFEASVWPSSLKPRQVRDLIFRKVGDELLRPSCRLLNGILQPILSVCQLVPMVMLGVRIFEHPGRAFALLLQDNSYALGRLRHVWNFVEVT